ncbi:hypothetical protein COO60DRAFT_1644665 [Scenedesmus sp. NREL 46B-D3]|nr:hypothetical protein COO60DRAFT_1644665 [Scenedesmus sp. NREL 46B-D3]
MAAYSASVLVGLDFPSLGIPCSSTLVELVVLDTSATVQQLCQRLAEHIASLAGVAAGLVKVTELRWQGSTCDPDNSLDLYFGLQPRAAKQPAVVRFTAKATAVPASTHCVLRITDTTGGRANPFVLDVGSPYITVAELRSKLEAAHGGVIDLRGATLCHQDQQLTDDKKLLSHYYIQDTSRQQQITLKHGSKTRSAVAFADISNPESLKTQEWDDTAPEWRCAVKGLNVEGRCTNKNCKAFRRMVVDISHGLDETPTWHFDLIQQEKSCPCPCCHQPIKLETCAFTGCQWRYEGVKLRDGRPQHVESGDWQTAGSLYERFRGASSAYRADWERLMIKTRPAPGPAAPGTCSKCQEAVLGAGMAGGPGKTLPCGHHVHDACLVSGGACPSCSNPAAPNAAAAAAAVTAAANLRPESLIPLLKTLQAALGPVLSALKTGAAEPAEETGTRAPGASSSHVY